MHLDMIRAMEEAVRLIAILGHLLSLFIASFAPSVHVGRLAFRLRTLVKGETLSTHYDLLVFRKLDASDEPHSDEHGDLKASGDDGNHCVVSSNCALFQECQVSQSRPTLHGLDVGVSNRNTDWGRGVKAFGDYDAPNYFVSH